MLSGDRKEKNKNLKLYLDHHKMLHSQSHSSQFTKTSTIPFRIHLRIHHHISHLTNVQQYYLHISHSHSLLLPAHPHKQTFAIITLYLVESVFQHDDNNEVLLCFQNEQGTF